MAGLHQVNVPAGVWDMEELMPGTDIVGFLSLSFFEQHPFTVDYGRKKVVLERAESLSRLREGTDETGHRYTRYFTKLPGFVGLGQSTATRQAMPDVMFQEIIYDGVVGHIFLSQFIVTYDLQHSEWHRVSVRHIHKNWTGKV